MTSNQQDLNGSGNVFMTCVICNGPIEAEKNSGWANGYNAAPVARGRCCKTCDDTVVHEARLDLMEKNIQRGTVVEERKSTRRGRSTNLYHKNGTPLAMEYAKIRNTQCEIKYCNNSAVWLSCKADNGDCHPAEIKNGLVAHYDGGVHLWDFSTEHKPSSMYHHKGQGHKDSEVHKISMPYDDLVEDPDNAVMNRVKEWQLGLVRTGTYKLCLSHARVTNLDSVQNYISPLLKPFKPSLDPEKEREQRFVRIRMSNSALINLRYMLMTDELFSRYIQHNVGQLSHRAHSPEELKDHQEEMVDSLTQEFGGNWNYSSTNTQAWQAQGERLLAMLQVLDGGPPISASEIALENTVPTPESYVHPETGEVTTASAHVWGIQTALNLSNASVYLWSNDTFDIAKSMPLPKHQVSLPLLQYPNMFFSFETAYALSMPHAANQDLVTATAGLANDLNIEVDLSDDAATQLGEKNWMYLRETTLESGEPAVEIIHDMTANGESLIVRDILTHGATYPDDFENPEYVRISLAMLNFLNTPLLYSETRKLERSVRRDLERTTGAKGYWDDPTYESNLIILRRPQRRVERNEREDDDPMHHDFQWWTVGHFRNQYYPSLGDVDDPHSHKLIWIGHFLKGPKDKPVRIKPTNLVIQ